MKTKHTLILSSKQSKNLMLDALCDDRVSKAIKRELSKIALDYLDEKFRQTVETLQVTDAHADGTLTIKVTLKEDNANSNQTN